MTLRATSWAWQGSQASGLDRLVLLALTEWEHCDGRGVLPEADALDVLAEMCNIEPYMVEDSLGILAALGDVSFDPGHDYRSRGLNGVSFLLPAVAQQGVPVPMRPVRESPKGFVYLIGSQSGGLAKIGRARDVIQRLRAIQAMSPVELDLLWSSSGGRELEARLHVEFSNYRTHGEWFDFGNLDPVAMVSEAAKRLGGAS